MPNNTFHSVQTHHRRWLRVAFTLRMWFICGTLLAIIFSMIGCSKDRTTSPIPAPVRSETSSVPLTEAEATSIVERFLQEKKIDVSDYELPTSQQTGQEWEFFYHLKPPGVPGGHFMIHVDAAGKPSLISGA